MDEMVIAAVLLISADEKPAYSTATKTMTVPRVTFISLENAGKNSKEIFRKEMCEQGM